MKPGRCVIICMASVAAIGALTLTSGCDVEDQGTPTLERAPTMTEEPAAPTVTPTPGMNEAEQPAAPAPPMPMPDAANPAGTTEQPSPAPTDSTEKPSAPAY